MELNDYQNKAQETAIYPGKGTVNGLLYTCLGLGETGEVQGKCKKVLRDDGGKLTEEKRQAMADELGDLCWYVANTASELGFTLEEVCQRNVDKLSSRMDRGVLGGSGDNR